MANSHTFAGDVFGCIAARLVVKAAELELLAETPAFEGWLVGEAYLACKQRQESYPFCEVTARPTYASEGVAVEGNPDRDVGGLRVGGPDDGADHCWLFAEFVVVGDGSGRDSPKVVAAADRLRRLGWKKSAALLITVTVNCGGGSSEGKERDWPALTDSVVIPFPGGGAVILTAIDVKRDPTDTLTRTHR